MGDNTLIRKRKGIRELWWMLLFIFAILSFTAILYQFEPFSEFWNNLLSNFLTIFSAGFSAGCATLVFRRYEPTDAPRIVWRLLAIGLWSWTFAEFIWAIYNMRYGEVGITSADFFWTAAYGLFFGAVYFQYQLVFRPTKRQSFLWISLWVSAAFLLTILTAWMLVNFVEEDWGLPLWISSFYPAADFVIGLAALRIARRFRGGALGYPWLGLFVFAIADMFYAVLEMGGFYTWSVNAESIWSMVADITYMAAYFVVGFGCFVQLLLLKYGPIFKIKQKVKKTT